MLMESLVIDVLYVFRLAYPAVDKSQMYLVVQMAE